MVTDQLIESDSFARLGLSEPLVRALSEVGYETPTLIQKETIPLMLAGRDIIGQAQTGTGKTAAFALPILNKIGLDVKGVQALVLAPTRELAIQVSEAFHTYAKHLGPLRVMPIYGGDSIQKQVSRLRGGMQIVVGTPGRIMDHLRRGTLDLQGLKFVVLDEADEMLRMGFIEDVESILSHASAAHQTALFSATMPPQVRRIAQRHLQDPATVEIKHKTVTVKTVEQHYIPVIEKQKLDGLTHLLETETVPGEAILIFTRTKVGAAGLVEKLQARGYAAEAMHGDMSQADRLSVIRRMRGGQVDLVVATDVAARGLDVEHIGLVINYDIPNDPESYVHRIGRTARAGRAGKAILFVTPREMRMMKEIERYTGQRLTPAKVPTGADVAARRMALFKEQILKILKDEDLEVYLSLVNELAEQSGCDMAEVAAAAARLARGDKPLVVQLEPEPQQAPFSENGMVRLFVEAGRRAGVRPSDIVGAIANEARVPGHMIGAIDIYDDFTYVDVPAQYLQQVLASMSDATIRSKQANIRLTATQESNPPKTRGKPEKGRAPKSKASRKFEQKRDTGKRGQARPKSRKKS